MTRPDAKYANLGAQDGPFINVLGDKSAPFSSVYGLLVAIGHVETPVLAPLAEVGRPLVAEQVHASAGVGVP